MHTDIYTYICLADRSNYYSNIGKSEGIERQEKVSRHDDDCLKRDESPQGLRNDSQKDNGRTSVSLSRHAGWQAGRQGHHLTREPAKATARGTSGILYRIITQKIYTSI